MIEADRISPGYHAEIFYCTYAPMNEWYWLSNQTPDESWVFVVFDTKKGEGVNGKPAFNSFIGGFKSEQVHVKYAHTHHSKYQNRYYPTRLETKRKC